VGRVLQRFKAPGVASAIVKDGQVVLAQGYGARRLGESTPVNGQTRFGIASNTKAFAARALGMLVEEGKLEAERLTLKPASPDVDFSFDFQDLDLRPVTQGH
jgi:CubicO group peptidase (beta-lactamase class C family)